MRTTPGTAVSLFSIGLAGALMLASCATEQAPPRQVTAQDLAAPPDATISFDAQQMRLIIGGSGGKGVLSFQGKQYPFTMSGASLGGIGYTGVNGVGNVHFLTRVEDFSGTYQGIGVGAAFVKGKGSSSFENSKGVVISTKSSSDGLALNLGVSAVTIKLEQY